MGRGKWAAAVTVSVVVLLCGCQSQRTADRLTTHLNRTMAEFSAATGWVPSSFYETDDGRVFVVDGPTSVHLNPGYSGTYIKTGPTIATYQCRLLITAKRQNARGNAESWVIKQIDWRGNC